MKKLNTSAILFDLDGTLLDTLEDISDAMNIVMNRYGFPSRASRTYKMAIGSGLKKLVEATLPEEAKNDDLTGRFIKDVREEYSRRLHNKTKPYPGIPELLHQLRDMNYPLSVLSNKPQAFTKKIIDHYFKHLNMHPVFGARDSFPKKPDPSSAMQIAKILNLPPGSILYLGDTKTDMETARAAGMIPIGVLWGFRDKKELKEAGAWHLIASPSELPGLIQ